MTRTTRTIAFFALLIAAAYGLSVANGFVFDDLIFVTRDPRVQSITETHRLFVEPLWGFTDVPGNIHAHQYYRPLQTVPLALNVAVAGHHAWPSHLLNLVLHCVNAILLLSLLSHLGIDRRIASGAAAAWAVHPGWSEAVLWVSDVAGLGSTFAVLAILRLHMGTTDTRIRVPLVSLLFLFGLWFKEVSIVTPVVLLAYDFLLTERHNQPRRFRNAADYLALFPAAALYLCLRIHALGGIAPGLDRDALGGTAFIANALGLLPEFAHTLLWPFDLSMYHDFTPVRNLSDPRLWYGAVLAAVVVGGLGFFLKQGNRKIAFACSWLIVTTLPYLLVRWPKLNVYAERYTYLPSMGVFMLAALALSAFARSHARWHRARLGRLAVVVWGFIVSTFVVADVARTRDWHDEVSLYTKTLRSGGRAELVRNNLALRYLELGRYTDGLAEIKALLAIDPDFAEAHHNLGLLSLAVGDLPGALSAFQRAHELTPNKPETLLNLGYVYDRLGRRDQATAAYWRLTQVDPSRVSAWYNLALEAVDARQWENAGLAINRVLSLDPADKAALALRASLAQPTRPSAAGAESRGATGAGLTHRRCERARRLIENKKYRDAEELLHAAAWLDERSALPHHYLANLYYLTGRIRLAFDETREALARAPRNKLYRTNMQKLSKILSHQTHERVEP